MVRARVRVRVRTNFERRFGDLTRVDGVCVRVRVSVRVRVKVRVRVRYVQG